MDRYPFSVFLQVTIQFSVQYMVENMSINRKTQELKARMQSLLQGGGEKAMEKQKATGKLTARERILELLDEGSFHEYDLFIQHSGKDF